MKKIVTLVPSATEIVSFLGFASSIVGKSHECDYPKSLKNVKMLTSPKLDINGTSSQINIQVNKILENSLSVYKVDVDQLKFLDPDIIVTQSHCDVCAVSLPEVEEITNKHLDKETQIVSLQPNTLKEIFNDIFKVAEILNIEKNKINSIIKPLNKRLITIKNKTKNLKNAKIACIEWIDPLMVGGNWIPELVKLSGGTDVFGNIGKDSHWIKFREIEEKDPEIIIFLPCGFNINQTKKEVINLFLTDNNWKNLKAYKTKKIFIVDGNQYFNRPGPRIVDSLEILAEIIHPNIFNYQYKNSGWINFFDLLSH